MKSRVMLQVGDRRLVEEEWPVPAMRPTEAILEVEACGLCGSDVEQYRGTFAATGLNHYPIIPGHEPIGRIVDIGADAARLWGVKKGDRVALEPNLSCGRCERCLSGHYQSCHSLLPEGAVSTYGFMPADLGHGLWGGYSQYMHLHERTMMHRVPESVPLAIASLYQPLAAGISWAVQIPQTRLGDVVLILGHGQRGLGAVVAAKRAGASLVIITGTSRSRNKLEVARVLGADHTIAADVENVVGRVQAITGGRGVDVVVDVTPAATQPVLDAIEVARTGATIVLAGVKGKSALALNVDRLLYKELTLRGVYSQGNEAFREAFRIIMEDPARLAGLHTHEFRLEEAEKAIQTLARERHEGPEPICVTLHPSAETMST